MICATQPGPRGGAPHAHAGSILKRARYARESHNAPWATYLGPPRGPHLRAHIWPTQEAPALRPPGAFALSPAGLVPEAPTAATHLGERFVALLPARRGPTEPNTMSACRRPRDARPDTQARVRSPVRSGARTAPSLAAVSRSQWAAQVAPKRNASNLFRAESLATALRCRVDFAPHFVPKPHFAARFGPKLSSRAPISLPLSI